MTALTTYLSGMRASIRPVTSLSAARLWEIDALRGVAILMMVVYHLLWDLQGFVGYEVDVYRGFWHVWQVITASLFLGLVGLSLTLSYNRALAHRATPPQLWPKYLMRGVQVFSWGIVVSIVTFIFDPVYYVRFGILHLIGLSIIIAYPLLRFTWLNLVLGLLIIALGAVVSQLGLDVAWLGWVGLDATPGATFDHSPLIPWFSRVLIGIFLGNTLYRGGARRYSLPDLSQWAPVRVLRLMGENSLLIYLVHQPIIIMLLILFGVVRF